MTGCTRPATTSLCDEATALLHVVVIRPTRTDKYWLIVTNVDTDCYLHTVAVMVVELQTVKTDQVTVFEMCIVQYILVSCWVSLWGIS